MSTIYWSYVTIYEHATNLLGSTYRKQFIYYSITVFKNADFLFLSRSIVTGDGFLWTRQCIFEIHKRLSESL
jgi:hypothetical protein